jgi:hypothetical protein
MWLVTAWQRISPKIIVKVFRKCCIFNVLDTTDNDMLWDGFKEDGNVQIMCQEDGGTECKNGDSDTDW